MRSAWKTAFFILFFPVFFLQAQPRQTETEQSRIALNKIKRLESHSLKLNKDIDKRTFLDHVQQFDSEGRIQQQVYYDSTELEMNKWSFSYKQGRLATEVFCTYRDTIAKTSFFYDEHGFPALEVTENQEGRTLSKLAFVCDKKGRITEARAEVFPEINSYVKQAYGYDQRGFLMLRFLSENKSFCKLHFDYTYDKSGRLLKIQSSSADSLPGGAIEYDYGRGGQIHLFSVKSGLGKRFKCYYTTDSHGHIVEELKSYSLNSVVLDQQHDVFTMDSKGCIKKRLRYKMNNELYMLYNYTYSYFN
jgi:hypothetical protein